MCPNDFVAFPSEKEHKKIFHKLEQIEMKQDKILRILGSKAGAASKLDVAERFLENSKISKIPISKAPDLLYPSIYSTRQHAVKAIKTLQKKGLLAVKGGFVILNANEVNHGGI